MEPPLPARRPDDPFATPNPDGAPRPAFDVGEFPQGTPFSRWALARYLVGRVILERVSWSLLTIAVVLLVLAALAQFLAHVTFLAVLLVVLAVIVLLMRALLTAVLRRLMGAAAYGPLEERLGEIVDGASSDVLAELRRVGLPSRIITLPLIGVRLVNRKRKDTLTRLGRFEVERAVSRARLDELHMLMREATGATGSRPDTGPFPAGRVMTWPAPAASSPPTVPPAASSADREPFAADVRAAVSIVFALAVIGALLGFVWAVWSPPGPRALVISPGALQVDETEAYIATDGRFLVLAVVVGVVAGLLAWSRARNRGPLVLLALGVGGLVGSVLTALVGRLVGGGTEDGKANTLIDQLPLGVHARGLYFVEAALAVLVYGMLVAFTTRDDLGRADPVREAMLVRNRPYPVDPYGQAYPPPGVAQPAPRPSPYGPPSVGPGDQPQDGRRDGDAPGLLQQRDLPPQ